MSLGIAGSASASLFPALNGRALVNQINLPNLFSFNGVSAPPFKFSGHLAFNSNPGVGADFLSVKGAMTPIDLGPFLRVFPLPGTNANAGNMLGGSLRVTKVGNGASATLLLDPALAVIPMFGTNLQGMIFGSFDGKNFTPFTFSTIPGQNWAGTMRLQGTLEIRSPLDPAGPVLFRAEPLRLPNGTAIPFEAQMTGSGLESFELRLTIPNGLQFTLFPGTDQQSSFQVGDNSATCLLVSSDGRVYFDSGTRTLDLNGLASVRGRIELGFEPVDRRPVMSTVSLADFQTQLGHSQERTVTIKNLNTVGSQLVVDASVTSGSPFTVLPNRLILGGNESGQLRVRFTPRSSASFNSQLVLSNNSAQPLVAVPLKGAVVTAPKMHVHVAAVNFGVTPLGATRGQPVRISNLGDGNLLVTNITTTATPFTRNLSSFTVSPGSFRDLLVSFTPGITNATNGSLRFTSNDPAGTTNVNLSGSASVRKASGIAGHGRPVCGSLES
jgi:hypothetical protein